MKIYAAYGSNMNLGQMARRCPEAKVIGVGILKKYKLAFEGNGHANIKLAEGHEVPIVLWEIRPRCENALDTYEGYPRYYIKENIMVETEAGEVEAMVYVMAKEYEKLTREPTTIYYNTIYKGYLDNNIPVGVLEEALKEIKTFIQE